jgi:molybdopterin-biosynthesis enzyme MoeA-like protein
MARFCFSLGMALKRVEVIGDDEDEIIEATRRMSKNYDFVVTSGGIGPTSASCLLLPASDMIRSGLSNTL